MFSTAAVGAQRAVRIQLGVFHHVDEVGVQVQAPALDHNDAIAIDVPATSEVHDVVGAVDDASDVGAARSAVEVCLHVDEVYASDLPATAVMRAVDGAVHEYSRDAPGEGRETRWLH